MIPLTIILWTASIFLLIISMSMKNNFKAHEEKKTITKGRISNIKFDTEGSKGQVFVTYLMNGEERSESAEANVIRKNSNDWLGKEVTISYSPKKVLFWNTYYVVIEEPEIKPINETKVAKIMMVISLFLFVLGLIFLAIVFI